MMPRGAQVVLLPPMTLYREDLEKIVLVFMQHCRNVTVGDKVNVYESVNEMVEHASHRPRCFTVTGVVPDAELVVRGNYLLPLGVHRSALWTTQKDTRSEAVFLATREFLISRRQRLDIAVRDGILFLASVLTLPWLFSKIFAGHHFGADLGYNIAVLLCVGLFALGVYVHGRQASYISLNFRSKRQSFWEQNSDKIILLILGTLVGILGTLGAEWLAHGIFPTPK